MGLGRADGPEAPPDHLQVLRLGRRRGRRRAAESFGPARSFAAASVSSSFRRPVSGGPHPPPPAADPQPPPPPHPPPSSPPCWRPNLLPRRQPHPPPPSSSCVAPHPPRRPHLAWLHPPPPPDPPPPTPSPRVHPRLARPIPNPSRRRPESSPALLLLLLLLLPSRGPNAPAPWRRAGGISREALRGLAPAAPPTSATSSFCFRWNAMSSMVSSYSSSTDRCVAATASSTSGTSSRGGVRVSRRGVCCDACDWRRCERRSCSRRRAAAAAERTGDASHAVDAVATDGCVFPRSLPSAAFCGGRSSAGVREGGPRRGRVRGCTTDTGAPAESARFRVGGGTRRNRGCCAAASLRLPLRLLLLLLRGEIESPSHR